MALNEKRNRDNFEQIDVRKLTVNFLPGLLARAAKVEVGDGICVIQSFEPIPLYSAMKDLGFDHETEKISDDEYRVFFTRVEGKDPAFAVAGNLPLKPTAVLNFKKIDNVLADTVVNFWNLVWGNEQSVIDPRTKLLLSLSNGVGAGRYRQATRELVKAYALGVTVAELDELFSLFVWNAGVGNFASEIGPSSLFGAYQLVKTREEKGASREEVMEALLDTYGESNPDVNVLPQDRKNKQ
jgi:alkylhydroperoxidase/carboxymuconolactone decarboxylase family protein YurZ